MSGVEAKDRGGAEPRIPSWRDDALRAVLTLGSVVSPIAGVLAIVMRGPPRPLLDSLVVGTAGLVMPVLRLVPRLSYETRATGTVFALLGAGIFMLARGGLVPGVSMLFAVAAIFGAIYFGRSAGFALIGIGGLSFVVVGVAAARGELVLPPDLMDPSLLRNWVRAGSVFALLSSLLVAAITFVIGRVEAGARDLRVAYERLGQLHQRLESTKEEERRFLAHELHDEFGQLLTALKLRLQIIQRGSGFPAGGPDGSDPIDLIDDLISRVRRMSGNLRPPLLDEVGLDAALRAYLESQAANSGLSMTLETHDQPGATPPGRLASEIEITCFRIVQEAITNAIRHAGARNLRVRIDRGADRIALRVADDGQGFDVDVRLDGAAAAGHLGVVGMRERVRAHGGGFSVRSRPGAGTTIEVDLPLGPAGAGAVAS